MYNIRNILEKKAYVYGAPAGVIAGGIKGGLLGGTIGGVGGALRNYDSPEGMWEGARRGARHGGMAGAGLGALGGGLKGSAMKSTFDPDVTDFVSRARQVIPKATDTVVNRELLHHAPIRRIGSRLSELGVFGAGGYGIAKSKKKKKKLKKKSSYQSRTPILDILEKQAAPTKSHILGMRAIAEKYIKSQKLPQLPALLQKIKTAKWRVKRGAGRTLSHTHKENVRHLKKLEAELEKLTGSNRFNSSSRISRAVSRFN